MAQTVEFMFQNVAYRVTVYRNGITLSSTFHLYCRFIKLALRVLIKRCRLPFYDSTFVSIFQMSMIIKHCKVKIV